VSRRAALAGLGAGSFGLAAAVTARSATAQDTSDTASHLLAGVWQWNASPERPEQPSFAIFHADGSYTEWQMVAGQSIGIWRPTGERTADLLFVFTDGDPSLEVYQPGIVTFMYAIELDETGDAFTAEGTIDVRDPGGMQIGTFPFDRPATRLTFENNPSTGSVPATPVAATPEP
jgi:hypothetical protein